jgi:hypothetical protein
MEYLELSISHLRTAFENLGVKTTLPEKAKADLNWWFSHLDQSIGKYFITGDPDLVLFLDASIAG